MFDTTLLNVNTAANKAVWFEKDPLIFTAKITAAAAEVVELRKFCTKQSTDIVDRKPHAADARAVQRGGGEVRGAG